MLEAARELHKFFHDAKEVLAMIQEKENLLTDDLGRDLNSLHQLQVVHQGFEADLAPLGNQVRIFAVKEEMRWTAVNETLSEAFCFCQT